jgi:hypothetical protein
MIWYPTGNYDKDILDTNGLRNESTGYGTKDGTYLRNQNIITTHLRQRTKERAKTVNSHRGRTIMGREEITHGTAANSDRGTSRETSCDPVMKAHGGALN